MRVKQSINFYSLFTMISQYYLPHNNTNKTIFGSASFRLQLLFDVDIFSQLKKLMYRNFILVHFSSVQKLSKFFMGGRLVTYIISTSKMDLSFGNLFYEFCKTVYSFYLTNTALNERFRNSLEKIFT